MNPDLSRILNDWPYEPGKLQVRLVETEDGEQAIQLRLDLGILQMQVDGRPDGQKPKGFDSVLEYHETRLDDHLRKSGNEQGFTLGTDDARELKEEAAQFYRRYTALWVLKDFDGVVRDTTRNLRALDIISRFAGSDSERGELEPFRPYILMMRSRALASQLIRDNEPKAALMAIDEGLDALKRHFVDGDEEAAFDASAEVQSLREMRALLAPKPQVSPKTELRRRLTEALAKENYELAAILRDELRAMGEGA